MESHNVEYKSELPAKPDALKAEIVAFLNSPSGGTIYIGVNDNGSPVNFIDDNQKKKLHQEWDSLLSNWIANAFQPEVVGLIHFDPNDEIFAIKVSSGPGKPYFYTEGEGVNYKNVYIRAGSSKRRASDAEIRRMIKKTTAYSYDKETANSDDLSFTYIEKIFNKGGNDFDAVGLGLKKCRDDAYNKTAEILSEQNTHIAKVAIYHGNTVSKFKDRKVFQGSLVQQIDGILSYVSLNNKISSEILGNGKRTEVYSYPEEAVREAVVNAFAHRDFTLTSDIRVEIYDDRIAILSPGSLPDGLTVKDIIDGANAKRNPILVNALDKLNYIENFGTGIRRIFDAYKGFLRLPKIHATDNLFTVTLYNKNYLNLHRFQGKQAEVLSILFNSGKKSRQEIQDELEISKSALNRTLSSLKEEGMIKVIDQDKTLLYSVTDSLSL